MTVDVLCATYNGARFLGDFKASLEAQTFADWRLWVRDDGSRDETVELVRVWSATDDRVHLVHAATERDRLGPARSFARLLERLPPERSYVMFADQDDVWLPQKIERTLAAMRATEAVSPTVPVLVHTDLTVTDASLRVLHRSFWEYACLRPEPVTFRRTIAHNVTTGSTIMMNRALVNVIGSPPPDIAMHDWWCACVAAAFGRTVALHEATVLYRQHDTNAIGARDQRLTLGELPRAILARRGTTEEFRRGLNVSAAQARSFAARYADALSDVDRQFLESYARLPQRGFMRRKVDLLRFRVLPDRGVLHTLGVLLRG